MTKASQSLLLIGSVEMTAIMGNENGTVANIFVLYYKLLVN